MIATPISEPQSVQIEDELLPEVAHNFMYNYVP